MLPHLNTLFEEFQFHYCYLLFWYLTINSFKHNLNASNIQELSLHWTLGSIVPRRSNYDILFSLSRLNHHIPGIQPIVLEWMSEWKKGMIAHHALSKWALELTTHVLRWFSHRCSKAPLNFPAN